VAVQGKALTVHFSQSSATKLVTDDLALFSGADIEAIEEPKARKGFFGFFGAGGACDVQDGFPHQAAFQKSSGV
jgi:hypothetical protein